MTSTSLMPYELAAPIPLFFRLDCNSQLLVSLTNVMLAPRYWLDEPMAPWPTQLPTQLRQPIEQVLLTSEGGKLLIPFADQHWHIALSREQGSFWLICLEITSCDPSVDLLLQLPKLSNMASQQQYHQLLETLKAITVTDRLILWHYHHHGSHYVEQLTPLFTLGLNNVTPIRCEPRYLRAIRNRRTLSFSEATHQPMLHLHHYLHEDKISSRLDSGLFTSNNIIGILSLEYLTPTPINSDMMQLVSNCAQLLVQWQPMNHCDGEPDDPNAVE